MENFSSLAYPSVSKVLCGENRFNPRHSILNFTFKKGLSNIVESMHAKTLQLQSNSHLSICLKNRMLYSRTTKFPVSLFDFRVSASESCSNYQNNVCCCDGSYCESFQSLNLQNESSWSASEIADATNGEIVKWGPCGTICTDSRSLCHGQWFFAIIGEHFDAHDFVNQTLDDKGCVGVIGNRVCETWGRGFIKVKGNTLIALEKMAKYARNRFHGHVVGLTGSVGKTTTRTMIALALEHLGQVYQTHGNQNNHIGVALTLIKIPASAKVSVLELGMSRGGEILELARMCSPCVRVILNVGHCHMENFGSLEAVAKAKGELLAEAKHGDICVLNADDPLVMRIAVPSGVKKVFFGQGNDSDVRLVLAESISGGCAVRVILEHQNFKLRKEILGRMTSEKVEFEIHGPGLHLAVNACAAAAVAVSLGVSLRQVGESLSKFRPVHMRSELEISENGMKIINDVYNANLTSMRAALNSLKVMDCRGKRVAILGDMLELGVTEADAHKAVLHMCCDARLGLVALVGNRFLSAVEKSKLPEGINIICAQDLESLTPQIAEMLTDNDVVLVKGSRAMQMEKVVDAIKAINSH
ncbi:uncharacterized protein LOC143854168 [Tasmannia lanceolata]|uniref:uncharacterized protein LOC143854168 n=1 Tax=Tasmannia lanceolata TaxID=3420 RepID=UPI00406288FA